MTIAVGRINLDFYQNDSLKLKRKNIDELCAQIKRKFNISILEIDMFDDPENCVMGFSAIIPETWDRIRAQSFLNNISTVIDENSFGRVSVDDCNLVDV